jgi:hypothetical protein
LLSVFILRKILKENFKKSCKFQIFLPQNLPTPEQGKACPRLTEPRSAPGRVLAVEAEENRKANNKREQCDPLQSKGSRGNRAFKG